MTQDLCDLILNSEFNTPAESVKITVSIGMVENWHNSTFEQLYSYADVALYEAKEAGRNQIAVNHRGLST